MIEARTPRRWRARLTVVAVVAGVFATGVVATAPAVTASPVTTKAQPPKVAQLGKYPVGLRTETFVDSTRPSENVAPTRTLKTAIYYPAQGTPTDTPIANAPPDTKDAPYPLILFGLFGQMLQESLGSGLQYWLAVMEPWLQTFLARFGFAFTPVGKPIEYFGEVVPYGARIEDITSAVSSMKPEVWQILTGKNGDS